MRKFLAHLFPIVILAIFILIMNSNILFEKFKGPQDDIPRYLNILKKNIENKQWNQAEESLTKVQTIWNRAIPKLQFSVERDEIKGLNISLARLQGSISARDKGLALADLNEAIEHWRRLGE